MGGEEARREAGGGAWVRLYGGGIGDLVLTLPFLRRLGEEGPLVVACPAPVQAELLARAPWVTRAAAVEEFLEARRRGAEGARFYDLAEHPMQRDWWWGSEAFTRAFGPIHMLRVLERMFGFPPAAERPRLESRPPEALLAAAGLEPGDLERLVLLAPGGRRRNKLWPLERWRRLAGALRERGWRPAVVGRAGEPYSHQVAELAAGGLPHLGDGEIGATLDLLSAARAVVAVDNGLAHLAALQGTPTVILFGPAQAWLWAPPYPNAVPVQGACGLNCMAQPFEWECPWKVCMEVIRPETVLATLLGLLEMGRTGAW
ncbi:MAG: glycosyltransferase family 9 protein [Clostridia bacterium]|nr:glycosyltransferase family 9 protein [Clostridia bacterium]